MPLYLGRPQADWERDIAYNAHPPTSVLLALPVTGLDLPDAVLAWNLVTLAALLASLAIVAAGLPELKDALPARGHPVPLLLADLRQLPAGPAHLHPGLAGDVGLGAGPLGPAGRSPG